METRLQKRKLLFLVVYLRASPFFSAIAYTLGRIHGVMEKLKRYQVYVFALLCDGTPYEMTVTICLLSRRTV